MLSSTTPPNPSAQRTSKPLLTTLQVNHTEYTVALEARRTLLDALRQDIHLTGTKKVCDMGNCGACTVMLDGRAVYSCLLLAVDCQDHEIVTIEGLSVTESGEN